MNPSSIFDVAQTALDCVCEQMDTLADEVESYPGCSCLAYVSAGQPQIDCCTENMCDQGGMLTVHVESVYPSGDFPSALESFEPCKAATWVAVLVITASRCAPAMDEQGNLPSAAELTASAELLALDQYAILTALSCCLVNDPPPRKSKRRVLIGETQPLVSEGGCAAVEVRVSVEVGQVCACVPATS